MSYTIVKGCPDKDRIFREEFTKGQEILEWIMKILWFYDLCPECYGLMNNEGTDENTTEKNEKQVQSVQAVLDADRLCPKEGVVKGGGY